MRRYDFDTVTSTSDAARDLARVHGGEVFLVTARTQSAGRGRGGRPWASPAGGAWFTVAFPVDDACKAATTGRASKDTAGQATSGGGHGTRRDLLLEPLPLIVGEAVLLALREVLGQAGAGGAHLQLKWPNDVLLDGMKVAGVLCEREIGGTGIGRMVLMGVGINANFGPSELPADLRSPATTLRHVLGRDIDLAGLVDHCATGIVRAVQRLVNQSVGGDGCHGRLRPCPAVDARSQAAMPPRAALKVADIARLEGHLAWRGQEVSLEQGGRVQRGVLRGIDEAGRLCLQCGPETRAFASGEIRHLMPWMG